MASCLRRSRPLRPPTVLDGRTDADTPPRIAAARVSVARRTPARRPARPVRTSSPDVARALATCRRADRRAASPRRSAGRADPWSTRGGRDDRRLNRALPAIVRAGRSDRVRCRRVPAGRSRLRRRRSRSANRHRECRPRRNRTRRIAAGRDCRARARGGCRLRDSGHRRLLGAVVGSGRVDQRKSGHSSVSRPTTMPRTPPADHTVRVSPVAQRRRG